MASKGLFSEALILAEWFDDGIKGWFDDDLLTSGAAGAYVLTAQSGSYSLGGQSADVIKSRLLDASAGSYAVAGQAADVSHNKALDASPGSYALDGQAAEIARNKMLDASAGSYGLIGQDADITYVPGAAAYELICNTGSYALSGQVADVGRHLLLDASTGQYDQTGQAAEVVKSYLVDSQPGAYALSGQDAVITFTQVGAYTLTADAGAYALSGSQAVFDYVGSSTNSGGWAEVPERRRKTQEEIEQERIALGILPKKVVKTLQSVARKAIEQATDSREADIRLWAVRNEIQAANEALLQELLRKNKQSYDASYAGAIQIAIDQELQAEEEAVLLLLMEM